MTGPGEDVQAWYLGVGDVLPGGATVLTVHRRTAWPRSVTYTTSAGATVEARRDQLVRVEGRAR